MAIIKKKVGLYGGTATIQIDDEHLRQLIKECIEAIKKTHPTFSYSPMLLSMDINTKGIELRLINELMKEPDIWVEDLTWQDITLITPLEWLELSGGIFPNCLKDDKKLKIQKMIVEKIWKHYKEL